MIIKILCHDDHDVMSSLTHHVAECLMIRVAAPVTLVPIIQEEVIMVIGLHQVPPPDTQVCQF